MTIADTTVPASKARNTTQTCSRAQQAVGRVGTHVDAYCRQVRGQLRVRFAQKACQLAHALSEGAQALLRVGLTMAAYSQYPERCSALKHREATS